MATDKSLHSLKQKRQKGHQFDCLTDAADIMGRLAHWWHFGLYQDCFCQLHLFYGQVLSFNKRKLGKHWVMNMGSYLAHDQTTCFTNTLRAHNRNLVKLLQASIMILLIQSAHNFAHVMTAQLSWHVQKLWADLVIILHGHYSLFIGHHSLFFMVIIHWSSFIILHNEF